MNSDILKFVNYLKNNGFEIPENLVINFIKSDKKNFFSVKDLLILMSLESGLSTKEIGTRTRKRKIVEARQIAMTLMYEFSNASLNDIGKFLNPKKPFKHSTVLHAKKTVANLMATNKEFRQRVNDIYASINQIKQNYDKSTQDFNK